MYTKRPTLLYEELRLIEKNESEVSSSWKSAHVLLFFLAFVFGSFCTFCFHMLMYMFDEKCVLFPKLLSVSSQRHSKLYQYLPVEKEILHTLPVDFLSTQWVEPSTCYLPTYLPLISGIFGLVWITMFVMCSSGGYQTGLQSPWRALLPLFVFSIVFGCLCMYTSILTHTGLSEFCQKLSEATNSQSCSYTINVVTLVYARRISGVYQATRLTIMSAWVHTACWILSAALVALRVVLAVDFQLVRVRAVLYADVDVMLQRSEKQMHIVLPESRPYSEIRKPPDKQSEKAGPSQPPIEPGLYIPESGTQNEMREDNATARLSSLNELREGSISKKTSLHKDLREEKFPKEHSSSKVLLEERFLKETSSRKELREESASRQSSRIELSKGSKTSLRKSILDQKNVLISDLDINYIRGIVEDTLRSAMSRHDFSPPPPHN